MSDQITTHELAIEPDHPAAVQIPVPQIYSTLLSDSSSIQKPSLNFIIQENEEDGDDGEDGQFIYKLYRDRYWGCIVLTLLNIVAAMNWTLFSSITFDTSRHFAINNTQVNWLANIVCAMYIFAAPCVPALVTKYNLRGVTIISALLLLFGVWFRYAATASTLSSSSSYALLFIGSCAIGIAQCFLQVIPPAFSQTWFGLSARTTVTMILSVANPFGGAVASLLAPGIVSEPSNVPLLLLITAIITSSILPFVHFVKAKPPTAPTRSAKEMKTELRSVWKGFKGLVGVEKGFEGDRRDRIDFFILSWIFMVLIAFFDAFLILINQIFEPYGYSEDQAGYIGAAIILSGLVAAGISAPLLDRHFKSHLLITSKVLVPIIGTCFFVLIWVIKRNNLGPIFVVCILLGCSSFIMLPVALELAAEVGYGFGLGPETTSAVLYWLGNGASVVTTVAMNALTDNSFTADPPQNLHRGIILQGISVFVSSLLIIGLRGQQNRRKVDELAIAQKQQRTETNRGLDEFKIA